MFSPKKSIAMFFLAPLLCFSASGDDELLLLDHHHLLRGKIVSSSADSVTFNHVVGGHSETQTYPVADIDPHCFYIIRSHAVVNDAAATVELGRYCTANGLYTRAASLFRGAKVLDGSLDLKVQISECEEGSARQLLIKAQDLAAHHKRSDAFRKTAALIRRFPDSSAANEARALNAELHNTIITERQQKKNIRAANASARKLGAAHKQVQVDMHRASDANAKGLQAKGLSASQREFGHAIDAYTKALKKLEGLAEDSGDDPSLGGWVRGSLAETRSALIEVHINLGSLYLTRTNFQHALREANAAIAVDTKSRSARSFRARVASAAAESGIEVYGGGIR